ncbi:Leucine-responsive regulatory protein [Pseudomonas sp. R3-52-08]|nr:Leucine-responsive regulatory protein [Pseudomonas sp. R3-52-08]
MLSKATRNLRPVRDHASSSGHHAAVEDLINRVAKFGFSKTSIILSSAIERRVPLRQLEGNGKHGG